MRADAARCSCCRLCGKRDVAVELGRARRHPPAVGVEVERLRKEQAQMRYRLSVGWITNSKSSHSHSAGLANLPEQTSPALSSVQTQVDRLARLTADLRKLPI